MSQRQQDAPPAGIEEKVQSFYDRYPYPRPIDKLETYRELWQDRQRRRAYYHVFWPTRSYTEDLSVLVAGCGTSQAAKYALRWPAASVTAVDISATSVRCTRELKRKYSLGNLEIRQLPIEQVEDLGMSFDQIVCTGVLHHLANPDVGLRSLRSVLKPEGAIHLMVYAPYGRTGVYMLQEFCRRIGIQATDEGIRELISTLAALPRGHPLETLLRESPDFRHEAELADALLHPQDRAYSVPQLFEFLGKGGLTFGRWLRQAPYTPACGALANLPQESRIVQLPLPDQYAIAELFRGTMVRHSLVAYRNDIVNGPEAVDFGGTAWPRFVPIRIPDTICVQERLPEGVSAVLINRTHTCKDLLMPIDSAEKRLFEAIDGERRISDIAERALPLNVRHDTARRFFKRLWQYDQVVFDASSISGVLPAESHAGRQVASPESAFIH